jgi:FtsZ-binding cell division protein ZapB
LYHELRGKLNKSSYTHPFSGESVALVDRLFRDVLRSRTTCNDLRSKISECESGLSECNQELEVLRREHPRLSKENTELHRKILTDSYKYGQQRVQWAEKTDAAEAHLKHMQRLHQQESLRVTDLHQEVQLLQAHLVELRRQGAGVSAAAVGVHPRSASIIMQGDAPSSSPAPSSAETTDQRSTVRAIDLTEKLGQQRRQRGKQAAKLAQVKLQADAAKAEVERLRGHTSAVGSNGEPDNDSFRATAAAASDHRASLEESQLKSQAAFLDRSSTALRTQCETSANRLADEAKKVEHLKSGTKRVEEEIAAMRALGAKHANAETSDSREDRGQAQVSSAMEHRVVADEYASLQRVFTERESELQEARLHKSMATETNAERLRVLQSRLGSEQQARPSVQLQGLETELQEAKNQQVLHQVRCADLSAKLAAIRMHEAVQQRTLNSRNEEANISKQAREAGKRESSDLDLELQDLELQVGSARSEANLLQVCLDEARAHHLSASNECKAAKRETDALQVEADQCEEAQSRFVAEVDQARSGVRETEAKAAEARQEEERLRLDGEGIQRKIKHAENELASVQASHRRLSSGVDRLIPELLHSRAEQQSEVLAESEHQVLLLDVSEEMQRSEAGQQLNSKTK